MCSSVHSLPTPLAPQGSFRERRERNGTEERVGRDTKGTKEPQYWKLLKNIGNHWNIGGSLAPSHPHPSSHYARRARRSRWEEGDVEGMKGKGSDTPERRDGGNEWKAVTSLARFRRQGRRRAVMGRKNDGPFLTPLITPAARRRRVNGVSGADGGGAPGDGPAVHERNEEAGRSLSLSAGGVYRGTETQWREWGEEAGPFPTADEWDCETVARTGTKVIPCSQVSNSI